MVETSYMYTVHRGHTKVGALRVQLLCFSAERIGLVQAKIRVKVGFFGKLKLLYLLFFRVLE